MPAQEFKDKVVIITGGANGIGRCIADEFRSQGAIVYVIDKQEGEHFVGDISKKEVLEAFASEVLGKHPKVDVIINNIRTSALGYLCYTDIYKTKLLISFFCSNN